MIDGKWKMVLNTPMGDKNIVLDATVAGDGLEGGFLGEDGSIGLKIYEGSADGDSFSFKVDFPVPDMGSFTFTLTGAVDGDNMAGTAKMALGTCDFKAERM